MSPRLRSALLCLPAVVLMAQAPTHTVQTPVPAGGAVELDLEAGEYDVVPSDKAQVTVTWTQGDRVRVQTDTRRDGAVRVRVGRTPSENFKARVEVPRVCALKVRLTAGELRIGAVEGHKDLRNRAGEIHLEVPDPKAYGEVHASAWAGEIHAPAFGGHDEGLFNGFDHQGPGTYRLKVKVMAGEIHLGK